ncbi:MAG: hypothetical protein PHW86_00330 [Candidatus Bipolaricaulis sp.]|nr:hypothetical protein [Candidatus Bipolaricaulis sp.]
MRDGFWAVNVGDDIELSQVDVEFDDEGTLAVTLPAGAPADWVKQLSLLAATEKRFPIKVERLRAITATFHQCQLAGSTKGQTLGERTGIFLGGDEESTRSMSFTFEYLTSD